MSFWRCCFSVLWGNISALSFLHFRRTRFGARTQTPLFNVSVVSALKPGMKGFVKLLNSSEDQNYCLEPWFSQCAHFALFKEQLMLENSHTLNFPSYLLGALLYLKFKKFELSMILLRWYISFQIGWNCCLLLLIAKILKSFRKVK